MADSVPPKCPDCESQLHVLALAFWKLENGPVPREAYQCSGCESYFIEYDLGVYTGGVVLLNFTMRPKEKLISVWLHHELQRRSLAVDD